MQRLFMLIFSVLIITFSQACKNTESSPEQKEETTNPNDGVRRGNPYPALPAEFVKNLFDNCSFIDYVFADLPVSISQEEKSSIQQMISYFKNEAPLMLNPNCKPTGRSFYQINGEIVLEADFYFSMGCTYYVFFIDNKPMYSGIMSTQGITFFNKMLSSVSSGGQ